MGDMFTDGDFIELPSVPIEEDCSLYFPVFEACVYFAWENGAFDGNQMDVESAVSDILNWLVENDNCEP